MDRGHVFVLRGDIRRLVCDAWLLPTDAAPHVEPPWLRPLAGPSPSTAAWFERYVAAVTAAARTAFDPGERLRRLTSAVSPSGAVPIMANTAVSRTYVDWDHLHATLAAFVAAGRDLATAGPRGRQAPGPPARRRGRPLLAVPAVGTGRGGGGRVQGEVVHELLHRLGELADGVDIALVVRSPAMAAALRAHRRGQDRFGGLDDDLVAAARALADRVRRGEVVLFTGAGTSVPAGLPDWDGLLEGLAPGVFDDELAHLSALDKAAIIERRLGSDGVAGSGRRALVDAVADAVAVDRYALTHALLANLPIWESATLNYDELLELAAADAGRPLAVLPYERPGPQAAGWLLKLHGCVRPERREDIVLTRGDYLSLSGHRAALTGLLQAMLVTRHMLFVGFGLGDDHFHAVVHDVRRALAGTGSTERIGTALLLTRRKAHELVWAEDLTLVPMGGDDPARRLEVFLDLLANESDQGWQHVLDDAFSTVLDDSLRALRQHLESLIALRPLLVTGGAWPGVAAMLRQFGYDEPGPVGPG